MSMSKELNNKLIETMGDLVGQASMCWESVSGAGVFDAETAGEVTMLAVNAAEAYHKEKSRKHYPSKGELPDTYTDVLVCFEGIPHPTNEELLLTPYRYCVRQTFDDGEGVGWIDGNDENADPEDDSPSWWIPMPSDEVIPE